MSRSFRDSALRPPAKRHSLLQRPLAVAIGSATFGFIAGAFFWHAIGFWSFISTVILKGPDEEAAREFREVQAARAAPPLPPSPRTTGSLSPTRPAVAGRPSGNRPHVACSLAESSATSGDVQLTPCPPGTPLAPDRPLGRRGDLLAAAPPPSPTIAVPAPVMPTTPLAPAAPPPPSWAPVIRGAQR